MSEDNFKDNNELTEEQKRFGRAYLPNDPDFQEDINQEIPLIEALEVECLNCSVKDIQKYDTPITKIQYLEDCINKICPQCKNQYQLNPIEVGFELKATKQLYTNEQWQEKLFEKYESLKQTILDNLPPLWPAMELVLSVKSILYIKDCTLPMIMILLGAPSSLKTASLQMLRKSNDTLYTDNFTAKSFVSHNSGLKEEQLEKIDLLPKIKNKLFLAPEMASIFGKKDEDLQEVLSIFTRIADGHGLESDSGACGHRGYTGQYMFTMIGVAVDIPHKVFKLLGYLGPKLYFFRLSKLIKNKHELLKTLKQDSYHVKFERIEKSLNEYLNLFQMGPFVTVKDKNKDLIIDKDNSNNKEVFLKKIEWDTERDSTNDNDYSLGILVECGMLLAHLRAVVPTWDTHGTQGIDYAYSTAIIEEPSRAIEQLRNLARGHALSQGRNYINQTDLSIPIKVMLSTASIERVNLFDLLIAHNGRLTTSIIEQSLNVSAPSARRTMTELKATGLVSVKRREYETDEMEIELKEQFNWFLSDEFRTLRENFVPSDYREYLKTRVKEQEPKESLKEKTPPPIQPESDLKDIKLEDFNNPQITQQDIAFVSNGNINNLNPRIVNNISKTYPDNNDSDVWSCKNCKEKWTKYEMMVHDCKGQMK